MKNDRSFALIFSELPTNEVWDQGFSPFRFVWEITEDICAGKLLGLEGQSIAHAQLTPTELRLELFPLKGYAKEVDALLSVPLFKQFGTGPVSRYALKQIEAMKCNASALAEESSLHDFRVALRKFRTILPMLTKGLGKGEAKRWKIIPMKLSSLSSSVRDFDILQALHAEYGLPLLPDDPRQAKLLKLQALATEATFGQFESLVSETVYAVAPLCLVAIVGKQRLRFLNTLHKVRSARDVQAMHKVRKEAKALRYLQDLSSLPVEPALPGLQDCLGRWHDLLMFQDQILEGKKHTPLELQVLVKLDMEIGNQVQQYRALSMPWWEERR